ncbi:MAG: alkaline phosphatase family protein [Acidobacteriota bacterium]
MNNGLSQIEHIIVVMFENRSFDNVLGWLYDPRNAPPFDKVPSQQTFEGLNNTSIQDPYGTSEDSPTYPPVYGNELYDPCPDPNEKYEFVWRQLYNQVYPTPPSDSTPNMLGFINDYATAKGVAAASAPVIMNCFTPNDVPIISALANWYTVCDHWFASVPSQTFANRSYVHAGTSSGYVNNQWNDKLHLPLDFLINDTATIFNLLEANQKTWKLYYGVPTVLLSNAVLTQDKLRPFAFNKNHIAPMSDFWTDIQGDAASFPSYTFIEPNFFSITEQENDEHPQASPFYIGGKSNPSNAVYGELLLYKIFEALKTNCALWKTTLLVILFDEHGGTFDHYPPSPSCVSPDGIVIPSSSPGGYDFNFQRYGVRVPAVLVSPFIAGQTVTNTLFDHTSVLKTVINCFGLTADGQPQSPPATLLRREENATDLSEVLTLTTPRTDFPTLSEPVPPISGFNFADVADLALTEFQQSMLLLALQRVPLLAAGAAAVPAELLARVLETHTDAKDVVDFLTTIEEAARAIG